MSAVEGNFTNKKVMFTSLHVQLSTRQDAKRPRSPVFTMCLDPSTEKGVIGGPIPAQRHRALLKKKVKNIPAHKCFFRIIKERASDKKHHNKMHGKVLQNKNGTILRRPHATNGDDRSMTQHHIVHVGNKYTDSGSGGVCTPLLSTLAHGHTAGGSSKLP